MPTDNKYVRLYNKRILPLVQFKDQFLDYLRAYIEAVQLANYNQDCTIGTVKIPVAAAGVNNKIDVALAGGPYKGTTGQGRIISIASNDSRLQDVPVPPGAGTAYHVALECALVEDGVEVNPRTGEFEYSQIKEELGRVASPTSVVDNGGATVTLNCNTLFGSDDHSGRQVRVWLKPKQSGGLVGPLTTNAAVAFETRTVTFSGGVNSITTAAVLGQNPAGVSTTAADYLICAVGPTIRKLSDEDLRNTAGALFLAAVTTVNTGNPIVTISIVDQRLASVTLSDISEVFRRDAHNAVKILVKADASDVDEPQIEVQTSAGVTVFKIDEDGNVTLTPSEGYAIEATGGASSAALKATAGAGATNAMEAVGAVQSTTNFRYNAAQAKTLWFTPAQMKLINYGPVERSDRIKYRTRQYTAGGARLSSLAVYANHPVNLHEGKFHPSVMCAFEAQVKLPDGATLQDGEITVRAGGEGVNGGKAIVTTRVQALSITGTGAAPTITEQLGPAMHLGLNLGGGSFFWRALLSGSALTIDNTTKQYVVRMDVKVQDAGQAQPSKFGAAFFHRAVCALHDGRILFAGGITAGSTYSNRVDIFDPVSGEIIQVANLNRNRTQGVAVCVVDEFGPGKVLVFGGYTAGGATFEIERYDPLLNTWTDIGNLGALTTDWGVEEFCVAKYPAHQNEAVLMLGGRVQGSTPNMDSTNKVLSVDPFFGANAAVADMITPRFGHACSWVKHVEPFGQMWLFVTGGVYTTAGGLHIRTDLTESYDMNGLGGWVAKAGMMHAAAASYRAHHAQVTLPDGRVLVCGGIFDDGTGFNGGITATAALYNPVTDAWADAANMVTARHNHAAAVLPNGKVLVWGGGKTAGDPAPAAGGINPEIYDPATNTWTALAGNTMPNPSGTFIWNSRHANYAMNSDGDIFFQGWQGEDTFSDRIYMWNNQHGMFHFASKFSGVEIIRLGLNYTYQNARVD